MKTWFEVYVSPGEGQAEWPVPIPFRNYSRRFVLAYMEACREKGQVVRLKTHKYARLRKLRKPQDVDYAG